MKNLFSYFLLAMLVMSCTKGDDLPNAPEEITLTGNWKLVDWYDDTPQDINKDGQASIDLFSQWDGCKKQGTLVLAEDNTGKIIYTGANDNPKCPPGFITNDFFTTETWETDELFQEFILIGDDYDDTYEIMELTSETLILKGSGFFTCCDPAISYYTQGYLEFKKEK